MRVISLLTVILLPLTALAQQPYFGTRVSSVEITGAPAELVEGIPLGPDDIISPASVRAAIQALYEKGRYASIEVDATPAPDGGTRLSFRVRAPHFFSTIRLEPADLLERPLSSYLDLPYGERFSRTEVDRIVERISEQLRAEGYLQARIEPSYEFGKETRLASVLITASVARRAQIQEVRFEGGTQTFGAEELQSFFGVRPGSSFSADALQSGIANIRSEFAELGFLNTNVTLDDVYDGETNFLAMNVVIEPGPFTYVEVRGHEISDKDIRKLVPIYEEGSLDPDLIEEGLAAILEHMYQSGYFEATVRYELIAAPLDNAFQVNYDIEPGERHSIREVRIEGNEFFDDAFLAGRIAISQQGVFSRGVFSADLLDQAVATIERLYRGAGFEHTRVEPEYSIAETAITVTLRVEEGRRIVIADISFVGNRVLDLTELAPLAALLPGFVYTPGAIANGRSAIIARYHGLGFPDVEVEPVVARRDDGNVDVRFEIEEGTVYQIGRIFVAGNTRTRDRVVHRNSELLGGTPYDPGAILQAQQRLYATGLFNRVDIVTLQRETSDRRDLLIQVEDAGPLLLTYGIGAQDREGVRGTVEISHTNLFGLDRSISVRMRGSKREQRFQTTFGEPRLFNREIDGFASLFVERTQQRTYDANTVNVSLQSLKRLGNRDSLLFSASFETVNLQDIRVNRLARKFPDEVGTFQIAKVGASYIRDTRNDPINPGRGDFITGSFHLANHTLGSELDFTSLFLQGSLYRPAKQAVIAASARFGWNQPYGKTDGIPITERYFAGGSTTLRAIDFDKAGPEGGGNALAIANLEYRFPIPFLLAGLGGAAFYDTGTVFQQISDFNFGDFTHTLGFGIRYQTPLGSIRVDFGFNINKQPDEPRNKVFFTLGHAF